MNWDKSSLGLGSDQGHPEHPMIGLHLASVDISNDEVRLTTICGRVFMVYHRQDCCESVVIHDIKGNPRELVGATVRGVTEEAYHDDPDDVEIDPNDRYESWTWTNITFHTSKGTVIFRWLGESNGYYSESVDLEEITKGAP